VNRADLWRVADVEARCEPRAWPWAAANRASIAAHWRRRTAERPQLFNGRILLISGFGRDGDRIRASYFVTDFAAFVAWRDLGYPDRSITNGFAMAALQGADGAFICGVMGQHTANAGRVYFPSGTPDPSDLRPDGSVDLAASVLRELAEETALPDDCYRVGDGWLVVQQWPSLAFLRPIRCSEPAAVVAERIRANLARQREPELAGVRVIRGADDIDERTMPVFLQSFFRHAFAA
jgi:8-oxo-dGTP pyrophosphatase MutT (NUDIX family)